VAGEWHSPHLMHPKHWSHDATSTVPMSECHARIIAKIKEMPRALTYTGRVIPVSCRGGSPGMHDHQSDVPWWDSRDGAHAQRSQCAAEDLAARCLGVKFRRKKSLPPYFFILLNRDYSTWL
jgi:hypothetical protein